MKIIVPIIFLTALVFAPLFAFAQCETNGTTVIFINGIFGTEATAEADKEDLKDKFLTSTGKTDVTFVNGFNPSHVKGLDDVVSAGVQMYMGGKQDFDLTNILIKLQTDLKTQKVVLVGHSQGSFYTNAAYEWLTSKGVSKDSIAVYNIGTPASYVAGNGEYVTSKNDKVVTGLATKVAEIGSASFPLPPNVELPVLESQKNESFGGHLFSENYLAQAGDTIISTLDGIIGQLQAEDMAKEQCFTPPKTGVAFFLQDKGYMLADTILNDPTLLAQNPEKSHAGLIEITKGSLAIALDIGNSIADIVKNNPGSLTTGMADQADKLTFFSDFAESVFSGIQSLLANGLGGASLITALEQNNNENQQNLTGNDPAQEPEPPAQLSLQDQLDNIQEKIDLLSMQVAVLVAQSKEGDLDEEDEIILAVLANIIGESNTPKTYSKVLISEVKIAEKTGDDNVFIELYNPNETDVDLTDWYIFRNDTTFIPKTTLNGQKISKKGYFLIAKDGSIYDDSIIPTFDDTLNEDDKISLKNPNGDVVDEISWTTIQTGLTFGRKWDPVDGTEKEFELQNSTPRAQNETYVYVPPIPLKNILINEIQLAGETTKDEFIELYNPNDVAVDLAGFELKKKTASGIESNLVDSGSFVGIIPPHGVFLIAPQDEASGTKNYTGLYAPNLRYSGISDSFLIAKDNTILLYGKTGNLQDKVGMGTVIDFETQAVANPYTSKSVERLLAWKDTDNNFVDFKASDVSTPGEILLENETDFNPNFGDASGANWYGISLSWQSQYENVESYDVQYKFSGSGWRNWMQGTTDTSGIFQAFYSIISDENIYSFQVRSRDTSGNVSNWVQIDVDLSSPVVINEVALYGTNASMSDKWIELYNKTANDIDLTGWHLERASGMTHLSGIIPAFGYFILESPNNNVISDIIANQTFTQTIGTTKLNLLDKKERTVDKFYIPIGGWQESNFKVGSDRYSMERISPYAEGMYEKNWKINNGIKINGKNRTGGNIYGTPGAQNSNYLQYTLLPRALGRDTELPKSFGPYLVDGEFNIREGAVLTISPGAVLKFYDGNANILASGTLKAVGTDLQKIIFTSFKDAPALGDWLGIKFLTSSKNSEISNAEIRYAGATRGMSPPSWGTAVWAEWTDILLNNVLFENNKNTAVKIENSTSACVINNITVIGNNDDASRGVVISGGSPEVGNSYFENNRIHIDVSPDATPNLHNNTFIDLLVPEMEMMMLFKSEVNFGSDDLILP